MVANASPRVKPEGRKEHAQTDPDRPTAGDIARWLAVLHPADHAIEIRAPRVNGTDRTIVSRFGSGDLEAAVKEALRLSGKAAAVYVLLNGVDPAMPLGTGLKGKKGPDGKPEGPGAKAGDIPRRFRILFDCDPIRPADVSSTEEEKAEALKVAEAVRAYLRSLGWPEPILADSGNGWHLVYAIDLPNDGESTALVKAVLAALASKFGTETVKVDQVVYDPPRLVKFYGTKAAKGEDTPDRPHRYARVLTAPAELAPVPTELLQELAADAAATNWFADVERKRDEAEERKRDEAEEKPKPLTVPLSFTATNNRPDAEARAGFYLDACGGAIAGANGHGKTFLVACTLTHGFELPPDAVFRLLRDHFNHRCEPPWTDKELLHKAEDAAKSQPRFPRGWLLNADRNGTGGNGKHKPPPPGDPETKATEPAIPRNRTDLGNAERLVQRFGSKIRYCARWGMWLVWDGKRWKEDQTGMVNRLAKRTVRAIGAEAAAAENDEQAKALLKWALTSESKKQLDAMLGLAWNEPGIPVEPDQLDKDPWLLNCNNGTVDLRTGELRPHRPEDLITKLAPVDYDPAMRCPRWERFEEEIMAGDRGMIGYLRRVSGYALTGDTREHQLYFLYGGGRNGKSLYLKILQYILGDYSTTVNASLLISKHQDDHPTGISDLDGRRFVATIELEDGKRMAEALVKAMTGGDKLKARRMHKNFYEFDPVHKLFLAANHKPEVRGTDDAIWDRIKLIPFPVRFVEHADEVDPPLKLPKDKSLETTLKAEAPGVLALLVNACLDWQRDGLMEPASVAAATGDYRAEMDVYGDFLEEHCDVPEQDHLKELARVKAKPLYYRFSEWAKGNGIKDVDPARKFGGEMERRGFKLRKSNGVCWRFGLRFKDEKEGEQKTDDGYSSVPF